MDATLTNRPQSFLRRHRCFILCVFIACITWVAFLPSLKNGFVNRDDPAYVLDNLDIRGFSAHTVAKIFSSAYLCHYLPVTMLTYMTEYSLFGLNPMAYHRTSLVLHSINVLLVFTLFYGLSGNCFIGAVTALLFGIHPLRVEAVAWVAERKEVLSALFYFMSLVLYLSYRKRGGRTLYFLCLLSLFLSLLSKTMSVSQPLVLILVDYLTGRRIDKKSLVEKTPFFALAAIFTVIALVTATGSMHDYPRYSIIQRMFLPAYGIVFYLAKTILPLHLSASYYLPEIPGKTMTAAMAASVVALTGIVAAVYYSRRFTKKAVFGSLFYLVTLLPVLQIVNSGGLVLVADRYTYVPLLGMYFIVAAAAAWLVRERLKHSAAARTAVYGGLAAGAASLSYLTWERCAVWNDSVTLWNDIIAKSSQAAPQAYDGRGSAYRDKGEYYFAIEDFNKAIALKPDFAGAYFSRGYIYCAFLGQIDPAIADLTKAIELVPNFPDAWNILGIAYGMKDSCGRAVACFDRAVALKTDFVGAYVNRGLASMHCRSDVDAALRDFTEALTLDAAFAKAYLARGIAFGVQGRYDEAVADLNRAIKLNPGDTAEAVRCRALAIAKRAAALGGR